MKTAEQQLREYYNNLWSILKNGQRKTAKYKRQLLAEIVKIEKKLKK